MIEDCRDCGEPYCDACADQFCGCGWGMCRECADRAAERCSDCGDDTTARREREAFAPLAPGGFA